ncbi:NfeD family protein [Brevundimonas sp. SORGH_AS_0993]|uniref:NfeD family protein n=1 Tax=Brevundimonas sp. SORGH_AS_0993 TaxID=3041794 RepID=UPI00278765C5|nr:NfeD family protein [Brevundimonas sp. SORGH_AS_0993]MDQ1153486.1 membrane protein implicated in regulation of membrane protease activity [Brevundimonas sp. SORGH_AS_0993]
MSVIADLYAAQPFWIWLAVGVLLLAVEAMFSTEWLLWPAVSAGVVAVMTAAGLRLGLPGEVAVFAVLTVIATLLSRRLIQKANPPTPDINDRDSRLIGQKAQVVQAFVGERGRVFVSGAEWPARIEGAAPDLGQDVVVTAIDGSLLTVRLAD